MRTNGRRREDTIFGEWPAYIERGDYWKMLNKDGTPKIVTRPDKLTEECWWVAVPWGNEGYALARLEYHTVREHEDGTITVAPGDGSSNSILVSGTKGKQWHGFIDHGELYEG